MSRLSDEMFESNADFSPVLFSMELEPGFATRVPAIYRAFRAPFVFDRDKLAAYI